MWLTGQTPLVPWALPVTQALVWPPVVFTHSTQTGGSCLLPAPWHWAPCTSGHCSPGHPVLPQRSHPEISKTPTRTAVAYSTGLGHLLTNQMTYSYRGLVLPSPLPEFLLLVSSLNTVSKEQDRRPSVAHFHLHTISQRLGRERWGRATAGGNTCASHQAGGSQSTPATVLRAFSDDRDPGLSHQRPKPTSYHGQHKPMVLTEWASHRH